MIRNQTVRQDFALGISVSAGWTGALPPLSPTNLGRGRDPGKGKLSLQMNPEQPSYPGLSGMGQADFLKGYQAVFIALNVS